MTVANISEKHLKLWKVPAERHGELREAWEKRQFLWLVKAWNEIGITDTKLCATCPDSIAAVRAFIPKLWQEST